jgi:hypothetical protein
MLKCRLEIDVIASSDASEPENVAFKFMTRESIIASYNLFEFNFGQFWKRSKHSEVEKSVFRAVLQLSCSSVAVFSSFWGGIKCTRKAQLVRDCLP